MILFNSSNSSNHLNLFILKKLDCFPEKSITELTKLMNCPPVVWFTRDTLFAAIDSFLYEEKNPFVLPDRVLFSVACQ